MTGTDAALRALADPNRRRILALVRDRPRAVGEIAALLDLSQQAISFHLRVLRAADLVTEERQRTRHLFTVRTDGLRAVQDLLDGFWPRHLAELKKAAEAYVGGRMADFSMAIDIDAPPEVVFDHLVTPERMVTWMGQRAELQPVPGGVFAVGIGGAPFRGEFVEVDRPHRVVVSWGLAGSSDLPPGSTRVEFTLTPTSSGTTLRLVHGGLPDKRLPGHEAGWRHYLGRLRLAAFGTDPGVDTFVPPSTSARSVEQ